MGLKAVGVEPVSNDGAEVISLEAPYSARFELEGSAKILFHRYSVEAVEEKAASAKGSAAKKTDDIESYLYRDDDGNICLPGEYVRQAFIKSSKYWQDPRNARASMMDLAKAGIVPLTELSVINGGVQGADFIDQRRVQVQRSSVVRRRPGFDVGWRAEFEFQVLLPQYFPPLLFRQILDNAGRICGVADFRPTYGRFVVSSFSTSRG